MKYMIAVDATPARLASTVNAFIETGWEPIGGVTVSSDRDSWTNERKGYDESSYTEVWAQALVNKS
jgi:hypothetical protein